MSEQSPLRMPRASALARWRLAKTRNIADLRRLAKRRLPRAIFDFIDGGAEDECTLRDNRAAFERIRLAPRALVDVSHIVTRRDLLDRSAELPLVIGPTGAAGFTWPHGDLALAKVAAAAGIPFVLSTSSSVSIESIASQTDGRRWFQCYIFRQREVSAKLIARAMAADYEALIITVDFPVGGNRERDHLNDFSMPFRYTARNLADFISHFGWATMLLANGTPKLSNLEGFALSNDAVAVASSVGRNYDASFDWEDLQHIRDIWPRKLIVKGVVRPDDAERLLSIGVDGIVVSNHGGRQLDGGPATLDALPAVVAAIHGRIAVFMDGGIRRGSDMVKALALGADGVFVGRPTLYGLGAGGEQGAGKAIDILRSEFIRTLQLCGVNDVNSLGPDLLFSPGTRPVSHPAPVLAVLA
jgi:(S)-mandelate dehydrogenase